MAKITRNGGASGAASAAEEDAAAAETDRTPEAAADQPDEPAAFATGGLVASPEALREHARNLVEPDFTESLAKTETTQEAGDEPSPGPDYETWTVEELKAQLDKRGLPKTGKKDDLVLRLLEDDDTRTTAPEDTE
ncbi:SAP domain-containing protein [Streptomyces umbrinus]|uniref:SAP domain-containing protein n=1 Tax=Streptomyces umbrinus TaxID=67370 RepID=UPI003C2AFA7C